MKRLVTRLRIKFSAGKKRPPLLAFLSELDHDIYRTYNPEGRTLPRIKTQHVEDTHDLDPTLISYVQMMLTTAYRIYNELLGPAKALSQIGRDQ